MSIQILSDEVVNQIAAGEVVERPASVVRELLDNAIDAGGRDISIWLVSGGQTSIRIQDDGSGIEESEARLAFVRHATSKLSTAEDLLAIRTLGFRGEALSSIAAVAKVTLRTRTVAVLYATEVRVEAGEIKEISRAAAPPGTEVEVRHLFFNTPARRKFLKSIKNEEARVKQLVTNAALAFPKVRLRLFLDERETLNFSPREDVLSRGRSIFSFAHVPFDHAVGPCRVQGLLSHPSQAEGHSQQLVVLVNGRAVSDKMLLRAIKDGFSGSLKEREFPTGFVSVTLPPSELDVNVHPQKTEVRFRVPQAVYQAVRGAIEYALRELKGPAVLWTQQSTQVSEAAGSAVRESPDVSQSPPAAFLSPSSPSALQSSFDFALRPKEQFRFADLRYLGQLLRCYLLCEAYGSLYVVDMHAAHERYNYNLIRNVRRGRALPVQQLALPIEILMDEQALANLREIAPLLEESGFALRLEEAKVVICALPAVMLYAELKTLLEDLAGVEPELGAQATLDDRFDALAARLACHASVRSGRVLAPEEVFALFQSLDGTDFSTACPHGRPIVVSFSEREIERWFGRDR